MKKVTYRKFASIDRDELSKNLQFDYEDINEVNILVRKFEEKARKAIDILAPEKNQDHHRSSSQYVVH